MTGASPRLDPSHSTGRPWRRRAYWGVLALVLVVAGLLAAIPLRYSHSWDESVYLQHAKTFLDGRSNYDELSERPPALSAFYALGFAFWNNFYAPHVVQGLLTLATVLFAFLYTRRAFGVTPALAAAVLLALDPFFVGAASELLTDVPVLGFMLAAMWLFDGRGARNAAGAGAVWALAVLTRFTAAFLIVYFLLDAAVSPRKIRRLAPFAAGAVVAIAPYLIWAKLKFGALLYPFAHARRIVVEWTAPTPAEMYWSGLLRIFPVGLWILFALGLGALGLSVVRRFRTTPRPIEALAGLPALDRRGIVLTLWGACYLAYMLSIPHKEVRYLTPLFIPVVALASVGAAAALSSSGDSRTIVRRPWRSVGSALLAGIIALGCVPALKKLAEPWRDDSRWPPVEIAEYLRGASSPDDVIYAAHFFPVLALYSERTTVSLLPFQEDFDQQWNEVMRRPGYLVYYPPAAIGETHSRDSHFKPDQQFLDVHPEFRLVRSFPSAEVYRYQPSAQRQASGADAAPGGARPGGPA